jgi:prepilin-type N-terminal cleavage/methylation domain-containing protein
MLKRPAFTLIEVLISISLLGIMLPALYQSVDLLRDSNSHLFEYLEKAKKVTQVTDTLYLDMVSSDGNISIQKDDYSRVCIEQTKNSLYALSIAKVCWLVLKKDKALVRVEGNNYTLPLGLEERVEVNSIMKNVEIFDVYYEKDKILVLLQQYAKEPISFMIQGISKPAKKKKVPITNKNNIPKKDTNTTNPLVPSPTTPVHNLKSS